MSIHPSTGAAARGQRKTFPDEFPEGLKPRLRLFLSVDMVGSTHYKQSRQAWRPEILNFYSRFDHIFRAQYRAFSDLHEHDVTAPEFWKSNGDELLYVCELQGLSHAHAVMHVWLAALEQYRAESLVSAHWPGVRRNMRERFSAWSRAFVQARLH